MLRSAICHWIREGDMIIECKQLENREKRKIYFRGIYQQIKARLGLAQNLEINNTMQNLKK